MTAATQQRRFCWPKASILGSSWTFSVTPPIGSPWTPTPTSFQPPCERPRQPWIKPCQGQPGPQIELSSRGYRPSRKAPPAGGAGLHTLTRVAPHGRRHSPGEQPSSVAPATAARLCWRTGQQTLRSRPLLARGHTHQNPAPSTLVRPVGPDPVVGQLVGQTCRQRPLESPPVQQR